MKKNSKKKYLPISAALFRKNRSKVLSKCKDNSMLLMFSNDEMPRNGDQCFPFRQNSDLFYLTGIDQEESILAICPSHPNEKLREILFIKETSELIAIWYGHKYTKEEASQISGIKTVMWTSEFAATLPDLAYYSRNIYLAQNENPRFSTQVECQDKRMIKKIQSDYPLHKYNRLAPILTECRLEKEPEEIELLQTACNITQKAFERLLHFVKPGVMEYEIEAEITHEFIRNRANGHAYYPIVASGKSACVLHYIENSRECKDGDMLLLDFGAEYANYAGDLSRTIPVNGTYSKRQRQVYNACLNVFYGAVKMMTPGTTINQYHEEVCKMMEKELIDLKLFTLEDVKKQNPERPLWKKYFMHGTSHFIGLDVHDVGTRDMVLQKGMLLSCEPGIYIPEENIGVRIENDIIVDVVPIDLMCEIPIEADHIEDIMAQ